MMIFAILPLSCDAFYNDSTCAYIYIVTNYNELALLTEVIPCSYVSMYICIYVCTYVWLVIAFCTRDIVYSDAAIQSNLGFHGGCHGYG